MNPPPIYRLAPHLLAQFDFDEAILLDEALGRYFSANPVASRILRACREGAGRDQLLDDLVAAYRVDRERAASDLDRFLADLLARGLLQAGADAA
jgi:hypothetical protein